MIAEWTKDIPNWEQEYKKMMRDKKKAEKQAKKNRLKNESIGLRFIRKHSRKDSE